MWSLWISLLQKGKNNIHGSTRNIQTQAKAGLEQVNFLQKTFRIGANKQEPEARVSTFWAPLNEGRKWVGTPHLTYVSQELEKLCRKDLTHFLAEAIHFVYTLLLINEHFWVTAAKVDSLTHLLLRQIATIWTLKILIPWETAWMKHTILASMEITLCMCLSVCTCANAYCRILERKLI